MSQSLSFVLVHLTFSTRDRRPLIKDTIQPEMHAYMATLARDLRSDCLRVGGTADHVHLAICIARTVTIAKMAESVKANSSRWIKAQGPEFVKFAWQKGYAAFSVGPADRYALLHYIDTQAEHHARRDYQTEMRALFTKYDVGFDERFVWK